MSPLMWESWAAGRSDEALELGEAGLDTGNLGAAEEVTVLYLLAEIERAGGEYARAQAWVNRLEEAEGLEASRFGEDVLPLTEGNLAIALGQVELASRAIAALGRTEQQRKEALIVFREDPSEEREDLELGVRRYDASIAQVGLMRWALSCDLSIIRGELDGLLDEYPDLLSRARPHPDLEGLLAPVVVSAGTIRSLQARSLFGNDAAAAETQRALASAELREVLGGELLALDSRCSAHLALAEMAITFGRIEEAGGHLDDAVQALEGSGIETLGTGAISTGLFLDVQRARLAAARGDLTDDVVDQLGLSFAGLIEQWRQLESTPSGIGFLSHLRRRDLIYQVIAVQLELGAQSEEACLQALETIWEVQLCGTIERELMGGEVAVAPSLASLRETLLPADGGLLLYVPGTEATWIFYLDDAGLGVVQAPTYEGIRSGLRDLHRDLADPVGPASAQKRRKFVVTELSKLVLPEELRSRVLGWSGLAVVGRDLLENIDFEVLEAAPGQPLGLSHSIEYLPSLPLGFELVQRFEESVANGHAPSARIALADELPEIAESRGIALPIRVPASLLRSWDNDLGGASPLTGADLTRDALMREWSESSGYTLIYAHGARRPGAERPAELLLAGVGDSALVDCDFIESMRGAGVVNLAACGAAMAHDRIGDPGPAHLGGAFIRAGASAVLISSARLHVESTNLLLTQFHHELGRGATVTEALLSARRRVASDERFADPHHWANLQIFGPGRARLGEIARSGSRFRYLLLGAAAFALVAIFARKASTNRRVPRHA